WGGQSDFKGAPFNAVVDLQAPVGTEYIPTEEERRVFKECNNESFWYRSVPFSVVSMAVTQALVAKGNIRQCVEESVIYKYEIAGFCGYLAGKMSYMRTCQEKFTRLENSPLGEALRQRTGMPQQHSIFNVELLKLKLSLSLSQSSSVQSYVEEEEPRRKANLYEDLRLKNRENYEVTLTQKAETLLQTSPANEPKRPKKESKNIYGDTWEE
uniref:OCIA domain-containing protein 1 n=1 Tax=Labrus bergylta TaxID=56723 RepID=A0A3Q3EFR9_9LABR